MGLAAFILLPLWLLAVKRKISYASAIGFATLIVLSALGVERMLSFLSALIGTLCGLIAWDLDHFSRRLESAAEEDDRVAIEWRHLFQLAIILFLGVGVAYLSLAVQVRLRFNLAVGMVLVTIGGIGALVNWLRKREG
jgi:hypothetical protein